ncbi:hypothetical protein BGZ60DRAFT_333821, partial [Tricladium varicosporioides]
VLDAGAESEFVNRQAKCLGETRQEVRDEIKAWASKTCGECILWLSGRAGTGKSTIARTIAADSTKSLGASFFFSRDKDELTNASRLFTTLAHQLTMFSPRLGDAIRQAIRDKPDVIKPGYARSGQWELLICKPTRCLEDNSKPILVIIDSLDVCDREDCEAALRSIIHGFSKTENLQSLPLRILLTSRPEVYIRDILENNDVSPHVKHFDLDDQVWRSHVNRDISKFIESELINFRRGIDLNWPGKAAIEDLTRRADQLFIYAAVACSYIKGSNRRCETTTSAERLSQVLNLKDGSFDDLDKMYTQIILQAVAGEEDDSLSKQFTLLLGLLHDCLKEDICDIHHTGIVMSEIESNTLGHCLPIHIQYACQYWVDHLAKLDISQQEICFRDNGKVHKFLSKQLLHWLKALGLIRKISEGKNPDLYAFIHDAKRFLLYNRSTIEAAPLQTYCSALLFSPQQSIVRNTFRSHIPHRMRLLSGPDLTWSSELQRLETDEREPFITFAPDGTYLATHALAGRIQLWRTASGACFRILESDSRLVTSLTFSPDGKVLVSGSLDPSILTFWD